jgi:hypothetical protein
MPNPPDDFPQWVDLTEIVGPSARAAALNAGYQKFWNTYGHWPSEKIPVGEVVYLGGYSSWPQQPPEIK